MIRYDCVAGDFKAFLTLRIPFLDNIVSKNNIDCVFTVFGPIKWRPRCPHICGFGLSHIVMPESPFFQRMNIIERIKWWKTIAIWKYTFRRSADSFITENPLITERLKGLFPKKKAFTITNNYNQVFDQPERQKKCRLTPFDGISLLTIATAYPHKNLEIAYDVAKILRSRQPSLKFRFVLTIDETEFRIPKTDKQRNLILNENFLFIGKVDINECPSLYEQCDINFVPTLLECFTATYPEAMRMRKPIITTDLAFARGLCGNAALYYESTNAQSAADTILSTIESLRLGLWNPNISSLQLKQFDSSFQRTAKTIQLCESII